MKKRTITVLKNEHSVPKIAAVRDVSTSAHARKATPMAMSAVNGNATARTLDVIELARPSEKTVDVPQS